MIHTGHVHNSPVDWRTSASKSCPRSSGSDRNEMLAAHLEIAGDLFRALRANDKVGLAEDLGSVSSIAISLGWRGRYALTYNLPRLLQNIYHK